MSFNRSDIVFKFLIAHKGVVFLAKFSGRAPLLACVTFVTLPAEFNMLLLDRTRYEWTSCTHTGYTFASAALAYIFCMIGRTKSTRQTTNSDFRIFDFHFLHTFILRRANGWRYPSRSTLVRASGRDETTPLCRNQLRTTKTAQKRGESNRSGSIFRIYQCSNMR